MYDAVCVTESVCDRVHGGVGASMSVCVYGMGVVVGL